MKIHNLKPARGSKHRRKIVGRGPASGHGGTSTRGHKGQNSRSGSKTWPGFEGGQMPLIRRIPKRGFTNKFRKEFSVINVESLEKMFKNDDTVTPQILFEKGAIKGRQGLKILGNGNLTKKLNVKAAAFSKSAEEKIKKLNGTIEIV
jgi:large subunit ribosomal protein L15